VFDSSLRHQKHQGQQVKVCWPFFVFCDRIITETFSQVRTMTMPKPIRLFAALLLLAFGLSSAMAQRMYESSGRQLGWGVSTGTGFMTPRAR
jgi:hypothetical protein